MSLDHRTSYLTVNSFVAVEPIGYSVTKGNEYPYPDRQVSRIELSFFPKSEIGPDCTASSNSHHSCVNFNNFKPIEPVPTHRTLTQFKNIFKEKRMKTRYLICSKT